MYIYIYTHTYLSISLSLSFSLSIYIYIYICIPSSLVPPGRTAPVADGETRSWRLDQFLQPSGTKRSDSRLPLQIVSKCYSQDACEQLQPMCSISFLCDDICKYPCSSRLSIFKHLLGIYELLLLLLLLLLLTTIMIMIITITNNDNNSPSPPALLIGLTTRKPCACAHMQA